MDLENLVIDAVEPRRLGRFWEKALGAERLTDEPGLFETRLAVDGGPMLDLCFQPAQELPSEPSRLQLALRGGARPSAEAERLTGLGARRVETGPGAVPGTALADPEGNLGVVTENQASYAGTGPLAALRLDSADPDRDAAFWAWLTGWTAASKDAPRTLRHPSRRGPVLAMSPERTPKGAAKNRLHLDVRLESGESADDVAAGITARGGRELHPAWGALPWRVYTDPSGNELCVLPARS